MSKFEYRAVDSGGVEQSGTVKAATEADAAIELGNRGLFPTDVRFTRVAQRAPLLPTLALARRELRGAFSRWRLVVFLALWVGAAVLLNYALLPEATRNLTEITDTSRRVLTIESIELLAGLCIAVPSIAAVSITAEREQETLDQLRLTLLSDRAILRGKTIASMAVAVGFILAVVPVFAVAQFSVGLDNAQVVQLFVYLLVFAFMIVKFGLACSAFFRHALASLFAAYLFLAVLTILPVYTSLSSSRFFMNSWAGGTFGFFNASGQTISLDSAGLIYLSPSTVIGLVLAGAAPLSQILIMYAAPIVLGLLSNQVARWALARRSEPRAVRQSRLIKDDRVLLTRRTTFPYYLIDPLKPRPPIPDGKNALLVREFRWGLFQRATWMVRGTYIVFVCEVLIFAIGVINFSPSALYSAFTMFVAMFCLAIPATFGNAFTKERELGNFDMLRMTMLNSRDIISGKVLGGLGVLAPALCAILVACVFTNAFVPEGYILTACGIVTLIVCVAELVSLSILASILSRRTSSSVTLGAVLSLFTIFGSYWFLYVVWTLLRILGINMDLFFWRNPNEAPWWVSPSVSPLTSLKETFAPYGFGYFGSYFYGGARREQFSVWIFGQAIGLGVAVITLLVSRFVFTRYRMRDE